MARPGLTGHRKFLRLSRTIGNEPLALGCLELMWEKCYQNGDDYLGDAIDLEAAAKWPGERGVLCAALLSAGGEGEAGFIDEIEGRPGHYRCHDLFDHAPRYVGQRMRREMERRLNGTSLSEIRAAIGRKGAATTNAQKSATGGKKSASEHDVAANDGSFADLAQQTAANEQQVDATPAPAPAPAPLITPPAIAGAPLPAAAASARTARRAGPGLEVPPAVLDCAKDVRALYPREWRIPSHKPQGHVPDTGPSIVVERTGAAIQTIAAMGQAGVSPDDLLLRAVSVYLDESRKAETYLVGLGVFLSPAPKPDKANFRTYLPRALSQIRAEMALRASEGTPGGVSAPPAPLPLLTGVVPPHGAPVPPVVEPVPAVKHG